MLNNTSANQRSEIVIDVLKCYVAEIRKQIDNIKHAEFFIPIIDMMRECFIRNFKLIS